MKNVRIYFKSIFHKSQHIIPHIQVYISVKLIPIFVERGIKMREFSEIAKELRLSKNLTQSQLAERMWVKKSIISAYETDSRPPSLDMIIKYAKEFRVSTDYLLGIESDKTINVNGLTDTQINTLNSLVNEFLKANKE